jgi:methylmalonyl-CoA mutase N-terminal domain/subunit
VEEGKRIVVGVNRYCIEEAEPKGLLKIDHAVQEAQIRSLRKVRAKRNQSEVDKNIAQLKKAANGAENLMPYILNAVRAYASIGEICSTLRSVFGEYRDNTVV